MFRKVVGRGPRESDCYGAGCASGSRVMMVPSGGAGSANISSRMLTTPVRRRSASTP